MTLLCCAVLAACSSSNDSSTSNALDLNTVSGGSTAALNAVSSVGGAMKTSLTASSITTFANEGFDSCSALTTNPRVAPGPLDSTGAMLTPGDDEQFALGMIACKVSGGEYSPEGVVGAMTIARAIMSCGAGSIDLSNNTYQAATVAVDANCFGSQAAADFMADDMGTNTLSLQIRPTALSGQAFDYTIEIDMDEGAGFDGNADQLVHVKLGNVFAMKSAEGWQVVLDTVNGKLMYDFNDTQNPRRLRLLVEGTVSETGAISNITNAAGIYFEGNGGGGDYGLQGSAYHVDGMEIYTLKGNNTNGYATYHAKWDNATTESAGYPKTACIDGTGCAASAITPDTPGYADYSGMLTDNANWQTYLADTTKILSFSMTDFDSTLDATNYLNVPPTAAP